MATEQLVRRLSCAPRIPKRESEIETVTASVSPAATISTIRGHSVRARRRPNLAS